MEGRDHQPGQDEFVFAGVQSVDQEEVERQEDFRHEELDEYEGHPAISVGDEEIEEEEQGFDAMPQYADDGNGLGSQPNTATAAAACQLAAHVA